MTLKNNLLNKALHQTSIYDFAEQNDVLPRDVDTQSEEFKRFAYNQSDLRTNEELYNRVVNQQYGHEASEVDKTEQKTEYVRGVLKEEYAESEEEDGFWNTIYDTKRMKS